MDGRQGKYIFIAKCQKGTFIHQHFYSITNAFFKKQDLDIAKKRRAKIIISDQKYEAIELVFLGIFKLVRVRSEYSGG